MAPGQRPSRVTRAVAGPVSYGCAVSEGLGVPVESGDSVLREREERHRLLLESTTTVLFTTSIEGSLRPSPSWERFTGQTESEYSGPGWTGFDLVHPEDRAELERRWADAISDPRQFVASYRLRHVSGEFRRVRAHAIPVPEHDGSVREWVGALVDVEDEIRAREELVRQSELTETITENARSALFLMDATGRPTYMNSAAVETFGYTLEEISDVALHDAIHHTRPDGSPYPLDHCPIDRALPQARRLEPYEDVFVRKDGSFVPVRVAASPIVRDGRPVGTVVEAQDISVERRLRDALEASSRRAEFLAELGAALDDHVTVQQRSAAAVALLVDRFRVRASVHTLASGGIELRAATDPPPPVTDDEAADVIDAARGRSPAGVPPAGGGRTRLVPITARGRCLGVLAVSVDQEAAGGQHGDEPDDSFLEEITCRLGTALDNAELYERERQVSNTLQLGLLRGVSARFGDVRLSFAYAPGSESMDVGGDWYDVFPLPDGLIGLSVGDVVGHGLEAATEMSLLRGAVRALAAGAGPAELLERLDLFMHSSHAAAMTTLVVAQLDPRTSTVRYACAGHPPPLVITRGGTTRVLWDGRSMPLGSALVAHRKEASFTLRDGDTLVLYTDGLIERRGEALDTGIGRLEAAATSIGPFDEGFARRLTDTLLTGSNHYDDACVLAARIESPGGFVRDLPADPAQLAQLRRALGNWLESVGVSDDAAKAVVLATSEAAANAIEHAYHSDGEGVTTVHAVSEAGELHVSVRDHGRWRAPSLPGDRGRGRFLMRAVMDEVTTDHDATGTVVRMRRRLGGADGSEGRSTRDSA